MFVMLYILFYTKRCDTSLSFYIQLSVRRKNAKEMFGGFFKNMVKTADEVFISGVKVSFHNMLLFVGGLLKHCFNSFFKYLHVFSGS